MCPIHISVYTKLYIIFIICYFDLELKMLQIFYHLYL
nr:MAG TPA_asm: hypothetical protein [Caudoviricetes sp.]DAL61278.1 MAG TPA_asm: hypothetical protein [Bacteriophage sp.]